MNNLGKNEEKFLPSSKTSNSGGYRESARVGRDDKKLPSLCVAKTSSTPTLSSSSSKTNTDTGTRCSSSPKLNTDTYTPSPILSSLAKWWSRDPGPSASNKYPNTPSLPLSSPPKTPNQASTNSLESASQNPRGLQEDFEWHAEKAEPLLMNRTDVTRLIAFGLYMRATIGDVKNISQCFSFEELEAWKAAEGISMEEAMKCYIDVVKPLLKEAGLAA